MDGLKDEWFEWVDSDEEIFTRLFLGNFCSFDQANVILWLPFTMRPGRCYQCAAFIGCDGGVGVGDDDGDNVGLQCWNRMRWTRARF